MNVYFDYQIFYLQKYGGISRYFYELTKQLNQLSDCDAQIIAPYHHNEYLLQPDSNCYTLNPIVKKIFYNRYIDKRIYLNEEIARRACNSSKPSVLHETYYTNRFKVNAPKVITIHDMIYELFSGHTTDEKRIIENKKSAILEADAIIAVSESTKNDLITVYPEVKNKVHVIYHGITQLDEGKVIPYSNPKPYILFVGNRDWYKNFSLLLEVYCESSDISRDFDLICFGGQAFTKEEQELIHKNQMDTKVKLLKGNDDLLNQLYKGASVLAYLSKYEGFGFPVLEAMRFNCPVICSKGSSLPEVAGDYATMIDVSDKQEVEKAIKQVLFHKASKMGSDSQMKEWITNFTWSKCASETAKVYKTLI